MHLCWGATGCAWQFPDRDLKIPYRARALAVRCLHVFGGRAVFHNCAIYAAHLLKILRPRSDCSLRVLASKLQTPAPAENVQIAE